MVASRLAVVTLLPFSAACVVLGIDALLKRGGESEAAALAAAAMILALGAGFLCLRAGSPLRVKLVRHFGLLVAALWIALALVAAFTFAPNGWDEGSYLLNGLAIRGYPTPYAAHRAPITSLACALFADLPWLMNPVLVLSLAALVGAWARSLWSIRDAAVVLLILVFQDQLIASAVDVMAELPASLAFTAAFYLLARGHLALAGFALGCSVLARWNLAVAFAPLLLTIGLRSGIAAATRFAAAGAIPVAVWYVGTILAGYAPVTSVLNHFFHSSLYYYEGNEPIPDFLLRSRAHLPRFFSLTPLGLLSVLWSPFLPRTSSTGEETLRWHAPFAVLSVVMSFLFVGAVIPRFFAPVLPVVALMLWRTLRQILSLSFLSAEARRIPGTVVVVVSCATGIFPGHALAYLHNNLQYSRPLSVAFATSVTDSLDDTEPVALPAILPLSSSGGHDVMFWLRRTAAFPGARANEWGVIIERSNEGAQAVCAVLESVPPNAAVLVPRARCPDAEVCTGLRVLAADESWVLGRRTNEFDSCLDRASRNDAAPPSALATGEREPASVSDSGRSWTRDGPARDD